MKRQIKKIINIYKTRRSIYNFTGDCPIGEEDLLSFLQGCLLTSPSPWNYQSQRLAVFLGEAHAKLWNIINKRLSASEQSRIKPFANAYGTILIYYDNKSTERMKKNHAEMADGCVEWEIEANAMTQYQIWTGLSYLGCGVNIQHFNSLIQKDVAKEFNTPSSWVLRTQMVFGELISIPDEHEHLDAKTRIIVEH
ncbi:MAG: nitroreductase family protein [Mycoplasmataceae bacterium]|jgi:predicted oxidoreductase (fatty acid repression mutant protein)|nr:nitroreductase family protein [Mycoplasmataceae bacterium]